MRDFDDFFYYLFLMKKLGLGVIGPKCHQHLRAGSIMTGFTGSSLNSMTPRSLAE
jgi:hypothetical protein